MIGSILATAGAGARFASSLPKQFLPLEGRPVYLHSLTRLVDYSNQQIVVTSPHYVQRVREEIRAHDLAGQVQVISGGATRQESVSRGLAALAPGIRWVLVHDAARPFVSPELIGKVLETARRWGACLPALPISETVKEVSGEEIQRTLDRSSLVLVQTPQAFERKLLEQAFELARREGFQGTDEASLVERCGAPVRWIEGEPWNIKVTWPSDLERGRFLWQNRAEAISAHQKF